MQEADTSGARASHPTEPSEGFVQPGGGLLVQMPFLSRVRQDTRTSTTLLRGCGFS